MNKYNKIYQIAAGLYHERLLKNPSAINYLYSRGITDASIKGFNIGLCDTHVMSYYCSENGCIKEGKDAGLIAKEMMLDHLFGYITVPISYKGEIYTFYGRSVHYGAIKPHNMLHGSNKSVLFNMDATKQKSIFIVESTIDAITLHQAGFNSVATFGAQLSPGVDKWFGGKNCYILYDSDDAGVLGAKKVAGRICYQAASVFILNLPHTLGTKVDVNSFFLNVKNAKSRINFLVKNAVAVSIPKDEKNKKNIKSRTFYQENAVSVVSVGKLLFDDVLEKSGEIWVRCPHHANGNETNRSLWIGGKKNMFHCFGCNVSGGAVKLVSWHLGLDFDKSAEWIRNNVLE